MAEWKYPGKRPLGKLGGHNTAMEEIQGFCFCEKILKKVLVEVVKKQGQLKIKTHAFLWIIPWVVWRHTQPCPIFTATHFRPFSLVELMIFLSSSSSSSSLSSSSTDRIILGNLYCIFFGKRPKKTLYKFLDWKWPLTPAPFFNFSEISSILVPCNVPYSNIWRQGCVCI